MNKRFPVLSTISILLNILGCLIIIAGILYAIYEGVIEPNQPGHKFGGEDVLQLISGFFAALIGFFTIAFSEIIGVLFAIEENTRRYYKEKIEVYSETDKITKK